MDTSTETGRPELRISIYSDYICPFCYLGHHRLQRLSDSYNLKINWCFLEIHPELSARGEAIEALDYSGAQWQQILNKLRRIADEDGIQLNMPDFISNSKNALLLAEAGKQCGRETFYRLHERLFAACFVENQNIGSRDVLREIAAECEIDDSITESAWRDESHQQRLVDNYHSARRYNIQSVPAFVFGEQVLNGVLAEVAFRRAASTLLASPAG